MRDQIATLAQLASSLYKKDLAIKDTPPARSTIPTSIVPPEEVPSLVDDDNHDHFPLSTHARTQLILAASKFDVGCDGRYREFRRR